MWSTAGSESDTEQNFKLPNIEETDLFFFVPLALCGIFLFIYNNLSTCCSTINMTKLEGFLDKHLNYDLHRPQ